MVAQSRDREQPLAMLALAQTSSMQLGFGNSHGTSVSQLSHPYTRGSTQHFCISLERCIAHGLLTASKRPSSTLLQVNTSRDKLQFQLEGCMKN